MKRTFKLAACLAIVFVLAFGIGIMAFAESNVTYTGDSGNFIFAPGSEEYPTDLFGDFKDVMPGDELTQTIVIKNDASEKVDIELFIKSLGAEEDSVDFLSKLNLTVKAVGGEELFNAPASETGNLTEWTSLGKFASGAETTLEVTLTVPTDLDNDYQNAIGKLDWQFMVAEKPVDTSDENNTMLYVAIAAVATVALVAVIVPVLRKKKEA